MAVSSVGMFSAAHWLIMFVGLGGFGLPMGVPPLPEDPMMANIAPEECLGYMSSAGMAVPDGKSANETERLMAEPEIQQMAAEIERVIKASVRQGARGQLPPGVTANNLVDSAKLLLTRPWAVYVSSVQIGPTGPKIHGGLAVDCGDHATKLKAMLDQLVGIAPPEIVKEIEAGGQKWKSLKTNPDVGLVYGFQGKYLIVTVGEGEIDTILKRAKGTAPAWLAELRQNLPVERRSTVAYYNIKAIKNVVLPMAGPQVANVVKALGFDNVTALSSVTGLDKKAAIGKTILGIDGEPEGILRLAEVKPLTAADLATIPQDATIGLAFRFDPAKAFDTIVDVAGKIEPRARRDVYQGVDRFEREFGFSVRDELLRPIGDSWRLFDSPSEGGALTGLTLVVSLNDAQQAETTNAAIVKLIQAALVNQAKRHANNGSANPWAAMYYSNDRLEVVKYDGYEINVYQSGFMGPPFTPAWCVTKKELIISLFPQSIKGYLSRPADFKSLAEVPEVAQALQEGAGPMKLAYLNSPRLFDVLYPATLTYSKYISWGLQRMGVDMSPTMLPTARAIRQHLSPTVISVRRTKAGIEIIEQRTVPGATLATTAPVAVAAFVPAVQASRAAARRAQSTNQLKQIGLAMHNYASVNKKFPPAYSVDKEGKPLLSWRVLILPFLEGDSLYKEFHLNEPWDSEHNKKLIARMPSCYRSPMSTVSGQGKTNYLTVRGSHTIFSGEDGTGFASITDGSSNTIMTVEVSNEKAVPWTKPDDFEYDEENPLKGLVGLQPGGFLAGFADGSVRFISSSIDQTALKAMFTRDGGEAVSPQEIYR